MFRRIENALIVVTVIFFTVYGIHQWWTAQDRADRHECAVEAWPEKPDKDCAELMKARREGGPGTYIHTDDGKWIKQRGPSDDVGL